MNSYRFKGDDIIFSFPYNPTIVNKVKWITGSSYNPSLKTWSVPFKSFNEEKILNLIDEFGFEEKEESTIKVERKLVFDPIDFAHIEGKLSMLDLKFQPRIYQKENIAYGLDKRSIINGDDMGLGKTFASILTVEVDRAFPCLVITPASVKYQFAESWQELCYRESVAVIESKETKKRKNDWDADVVIINYDILGRLVDNGRRSKTNPDKVLKDLEMKFPQLLNIEWKSIICDEAHFLKNSKAARSTAVKKIIKPIELRQFLTGTAISNKPKEAINLFQLLGAFNLIANSWQDYIYRFCDAKPDPFGRLNYDGASNTLELNQRMRDTCYIRHEKADVLTELPPVTRNVLKSPLSNQKQYNAVLDDLYGYLLENDGFEKAESSVDAAHLVLINTLRQKSIEGKMKFIEQYLKDWQEGSDEKLVIFGLHREGLQHLAKKFKGDLIIGGVSSKKKREVVKDFAINDKQFLFLNMKSGGTGVDGLQDVCQNMLIVELPWTTGELEQTIARLDRSGQKQSVNVNFILADGIDMDMWEMLLEKEKVVDAVNKGIDVEAEGIGLKFISKKLLKNLVE